MEYEEAEFEIVNDVTYNVPFLYHNIMKNK